MTYLDPKFDFGIKAHLLGWLGNSKRRYPTSSTSPRTWQQTIFADVGEFLQRNRLDPTPNNYDLAYQFRAAHNANLVGAIRDEIERNGALDTDAAERIFAESGAQVSVEALSELAENIEAQANGLTRIVRQSAGHAKEFSTALERHNASDDNLDSIIELTRTMVARTRLAESQLRHAQKQLSGLRTNLVAAQRAADVDPLTDLPNRRAFKRDLEGMISKTRTGNRMLSLGFCDIDYFKQFNDKYGHEVGDRVLRYVAAALAHAFKDKGMVGRFGGEEFLVALPGLNLTEARNAIDGVRQQLSSRVLYSSTDETQLGSVTFSAGVTTMTEGDNSAELLRRADEALYCAKAAGRNCVAVG